MGLASNADTMSAHFFGRHIFEFPSTPARSSARASPAICAGRHPGFALLVFDGRFNGNKKRGATTRGKETGERDAITEVITHMAFYAGWPAAMSAAQVAYTVLVEDNKGE